MFAVCSASKVNVAVVDRPCNELPAPEDSETWKQRTSLALALSVRSPACAPCALLPIAPAVSVPPKTEVPSVPNPALVHVVTLDLMANVRPSESVVLPAIVVDIAYRNCIVPAFETVSGAVTLSPGVIPENVTSADVGLVVMSTEPVENVLPVTACESAKTA